MSSETHELETPPIHPPGIDTGATSLDTYVSETLPAGKMMFFVFQMLPASVRMIFDNVLITGIIRSNLDDTTE